MGPRQFNGRVAHYRRQCLQSVLSFIAALILTVLWHELGHGAAARALGYRPVVFSGREDDPAVSVRDSVLIAAAGPLVSLLTGSVLLLVLRQRPVGSRPGVLLLAWLGLLGVQSTAGYLLTAPFFDGGDIGRILAELQTPFWLSLVVLAAGLVAVVIISGLAVGVFHQLMPSTAEQPTDLRLFLRQVAVLPWLVGSVVVTVVSLPMDSLFGPLATATSGLFSLVAMGLTARRFPALPAHASRRTNRDLLLLVVLVLAVLIVDRFVFRPGLPL